MAKQFTMTEILKIKGDWQEVVDDCRLTVGKGELGRDPSAAFKRGILIAEHSPIRDLSIRWRWRGLPYWVAMHWKTHHWESKVRTQRSDRTGVDRNTLTQDAPVDFVGEANPQHLIDTMRKRLCRQASPETRRCAEDLKTALCGVEPELSAVLVPNCVYRCGCPEMRTCRLWEELVRQTGGKVASQHIDERYDAYNHYFYLHRGEKEAGHVP